ncbi:broad-specificity NMP kinase [Kitasatospora sp. GP30]|uniref:AAA family ATPase n=1 Tax=Kitasatospora sp. GP30 TaxID=3035084 RepID=UPI000C7023CA|nr:AAA family ATPase [Kitasatospora sp. GP30]MDH6140470.1 broad-specificity NMP kinase [Kitasatospora sp. GP30]
MIVFVNGPFGVGKSTTVRILADDLPEALVIDPEQVGHMLWSQLPEQLRTEEFELEPVWPALTRCLIEEAARAYSRTLLVPMTIVRSAVFGQIVGALGEQGHDVRHFTLLADAVTIRDRLRARGEGPDKWGELSWEGLQVERCLAALAEPLFATHLDTAERAPRTVADEILSRTGLRRQPGTAVQE